MHERLQKILSRAGIASRRAAEKVMQEGRVTVNGETVSTLGARADPDADDIRVDGVRLRPVRQHAYLLLNKPKGVITTRHDPEGRQTVMDLVPPVAGLFPVGRLDVTTEGLIVLTNDGAFAERIAHPRYEVPRVYHAKVRGVPDPETLARLRRGVVVEGERMAVDSARLIEGGNNAWVEIVLHEGRHHEVRRLLEAVGHPVSKLRRVALGPVTDRGLKPGEFRHLTPGEVRAFLQARAAPPRRPDTGRRRPAPRRPAAHRGDRGSTPLPPRPGSPPRGRRPPPARRDRGGRPRESR